MGDIISGELFKVKSDEVPLTFGFNNSYYHMYAYVDIVNWILFEKPKKNGDIAKELLTGVEFDTVYHDMDLLYSFIKNIIPDHNNTNFFDGFTPYYFWKSKSQYITSNGILYHSNSSVTLSSRERYRDEHQNLKEYKEYLLQFKEDCYKKAKEVLEMNNMINKYEEALADERKLLEKQYLKTR